LGRTSRKKKRKKISGPKRVNPHRIVGKRWGRNVSVSGIPTNRKGGGEKHKTLVLKGKMVSGWGENRKKRKNQAEPVRPEKKKKREEQGNRQAVKGGERSNRDRHNGHDGR